MLYKLYKELNKMNIGYVRVSTQEQNEARQLEALRKVRNR
jgi:Resolvase, N terminal domain.